MELRKVGDTDNDFPFLSGHRHVACWCGDSTACPSFIAMLAAVTVASNAASLVS